MRNLIAILKSPWGISLTLLCCACAGEKEKNTDTGAPPIQPTEVADTVKNTVSDLVRFKFDFAVANIPSPAEIINDLASYNVNYNSTFENDPQKVGKYTGDFSKAVNLGIYNLDMAYAIANNQGADVLRYLKASMTEVDALGMKPAFDAMVGKRTETNIGIKDSLLKITDEIYSGADKYLRSNQRVETATCIFVGSWIEALHIICKTEDEEKDQIQQVRIQKHLWDQRFYLKNIIDLLVEFKANKDCEKLMNDLIEIHSEINKIEQPSDFNEAKFNSIEAKIGKLRDRLTKGT